MFSDDKERTNVKIGDTLPTNFQFWVVLWYGTIVFITLRVLVTDPIFQITIENFQMSTKVPKFMLVVWESAVKRA